MTCIPNRGGRVAAPLTLLALSMATASAFAQDGVTISGFLDIGVYHDTAGTTQMGNIQRSNLAFSGGEDLGGGNSLFFKLSTRMEMDTGATENGSRPFWHDEATVGLKGALGSLKFGRALDATYSNDWNFDPWYYFDRVASPAWDLWHYNYPSDPKANGGSAEYGRIDNGIYYTSPTVSGFTVSLSGSPEKRTGDKASSTAGTLMYSANGVSAMLSRGRNSAGNTDTFVGLKGKLMDVSVMGAWNESKAGASVAKAFSLGAQYTVDKFTYNLGWGKVDVDGEKAESVTGAMAGYALSKRTMVYLDLAHKSFPTQSRTVYGLGMSHSF
jgi:predicted porin